MARNALKSNLRSARLAKMTLTRTRKGAAAVIKNKYAVKFQKEGHDREWFLCYDGKVLLFPTKAEADSCGPKIVEWQYRMFGPGNRNPIVLADGSTMDRIPVKRAVNVHTHEVDPNRMLGESFELLDVNSSTLPMDVNETC